ncbi:MAG: HPr family phosphocarrier protein [Anaerolineae bacterium]|nr:HPr family phosphocarrier protein [Anaerolineae bacterium]
MPEIDLVIGAKAGLHARTVFLFVQEANKYGADIRVRKEGVQVNGKSFLNMLTLGATHGSVITIDAEGEDAGQALAALSALVESNFGETP